MALHVVILAAGQGKRMRSQRPKVLHTLAGRPMLAHVLDTAYGLTPESVHVVYGHGGDQVRAAFADHPDLRWAHQAALCGTGDAVAQTLPNLPDEGTLLVLYGDVPLISPSTLTRLLRTTEQADLALLTARPADPRGYGRIVRDDAGAVRAIVEEKDATDAQRAIGEINTGVLAGSLALLRDCVARLDNDNAQGEYYLTDVVAMAAEDGRRVAAADAESEHEILGVNNRAQLAALERRYQRLQAERLMLEQGVTLLDPDRFDLRGRLRVGEDVTIDVNAVFEGEVRLGDRVRIGPNVVLRDVALGDDVTVLANSVLEGAEVGAGARIGPYARLRPGSRLGARVHIGNFVEVKNATLGEDSKANHLAYVGDATVGRRVNVGAGVITCNYDGANKHHTVIEDDAFIGTDSQLVAPVTVGAGAFIGAGSTIGRDAPAGELTLSRARQTTIKGWKRPEKKPKTAE